MLFHAFLSILLGIGSSEKTPPDCWNPFVHDYGMRDLAEVEPEMRGEFLAYWYFNEVYNGGHMQYFLNKHYFSWEETVDAMEAMGARDHAKILREAIDIWRAEERRTPKTVEEYAEDAQEGDLWELDGAMYDIRPELEYYIDQSLAAKAKAKGRECRPTIRPRPAPTSD